MFEILLFLGFGAGLAYLGALDFLIPTLNKLLAKFNLQDEPRTNDGLGTLINSTAIVKNEFVRSSEELPFEGRVNIRGVAWKAEQISGNKPLEVGCEVTIKRVEGNKLYVETIKT